MVNRPTLLLVSFDEKNELITADLRKELATYLKFQVIFTEYDAPRFVSSRGEQKYAGDFLPTLQWLRKKGRYTFSLGIVNADLFVPELNFVFGIANQQMGAAVISLHRLQSKEYDFFLRRALTESVHELGHLFGLPHCKDPTCVMFFSDALPDTDRKGYRFCNHCSAIFSKTFAFQL